MITFNFKKPIEVEGKYLVKTVSTGPLKIKRFLEARCRSSLNEKTGLYQTHVEVNYQATIQISEESLTIKL